MSVATFFSSSVSFSRFAVPSLRVCAVVTVRRPLISTIRLSCVSFMLAEMSNVVLKFGFPVILTSEPQPSKQFPVFVAFWPKPVGRPSETSDTHPLKHPLISVAFWPKPAGSERDVNVTQNEKHIVISVAFWPKPAGSERDVREAQLEKNSLNDVDALPNPAGRDTETSG